MSGFQSADPVSSTRRKVTLDSVRRKADDGEQIIQFAVSNYRQACIVDRLGADIVCASDVVAMTELGLPDGLSLTLEEMRVFGAAAARGTQHALRMVTMPYWSFHASPAQAVENAGWLIQHTRAEVLECEGNVHHAPAIAAIVNAGIPVQAHIGLTGMRIPQLGGLRAQGKTAKRAHELVADARAMVDAGCFSVLCEVMTEELTEYLRHTLPVPVISIGSGRHAHGNAMVVDDILRLYEEHVPRHVQVYVDLIPHIENAVNAYIDDVRTGAYPTERHVVAMPNDELRAFEDDLDWQSTTRKVPC